MTEDVSRTSPTRRTHHANSMDPLMRTWSGATTDRPAEYETHLRAVLSRLPARFARYAIELKRAV